MTNFTLKTAGLLILTLFSTQAIATSPWTEDTTTTETTADEQTIAEPTQAEPVAQHESGRPGMAEEIVEPAGAVQTEAEDIPEPVVETETIQQGDVLNVNESAQAVSVRLLDFPRRGMTTDKVENELGRPIEIIPSIGKPPISRWIYEDRTVYFEYSSVIHVVAK